ncbi:hypothetical protein F5X68DRAFT_166551 [Plectosphaerella plurivora]|uniref:DEAD/DEAH box helicase n=1 Tax=Plectosphaerella plurivora TaxID=936078 RepID=A0A9P8VHP9_9PEZI|nr:hypothetical protein F5X68DRAFT_166551 [Plectosphaerella plurivora]
MADDSPKSSPKSDTANANSKEDADTAAARKELRHTVISEERKAAGDDTGRTTPEGPQDPDTDTNDTIDRIASPKKKRAREDDANIEPEDLDAQSVASTDSAKDRASRLEPEKKRHRDAAAAVAADSSKQDETKGPAETAPPATKTTSDDTTAAKPIDTTHRPAEDKDKESKPASAFASSGFAKLASSTASPFGSVGGGVKTSVFGGGSASAASPFASATSSVLSAPAAAKPTLSFGGQSSASPFASASPFGSAKPSSNGFGSGASTGFGGFGGSSLQSKPLSSFAKPGESFKSEKPAKPFGAPDSEGEDSANEEGDEGQSDDGDDADAKDESDKEEAKVADDKKKKLQRIALDDGESGETTILAVRVKLYALEKDHGWRERGSGMLKINVPESCVQYEDGVPVPGTFDASGLDEDDDEEAGQSQGPKVVRLIMRQDSTHRMLLNTVVLPAINFQEKNSLKSSGILFTAFEGDGKPVSVQAKLWGISQSWAMFVPVGIRSSRIHARAYRYSMDPENTPSVALQPAAKPGKRKRGGTTDASAETPSVSDAEKTNEKPAPKGRKRAASSKPKPALNRSQSTNVAVACEVEWPEHFKVLEKTHRALNLVYTFCCTRKHLATTFETIKSSVESHTKRPLAIEDVAAIAALRPEGVRFAYVDEVTLQTEIMGSERDETFKTGRSRDLRAQGPAPDISVGGLSGLERMDRHPDEENAGGQEVLYFEFIDGDLKRQVADRKTGEPVKPNRKLKDERLKMPVYSQKQMTTLIDRRNQKFTNAINVFLNRCVSENLDPEERLKEEAQAFIPVPTASETTTPHPEANTIPESIPTERKSVPEIVQELKDSSWYTGQIVPDGHRVFEPQEAVYGDLDFLLSQDMVNALYNAKGITQFFAHQAEALNGLHQGQHVVVATSTSSGKSLIYQLPVLHALEQDIHTRAMYIFPTKALAQDQKRSLKDLMSYMPGMEELLVETFDGDTPMTERNTIREEARIIFTNPDMLHITILPQEERWRTFLKNLRFVVVDELHYYNGQMGSHVAFIMRRLRRICAAVGNRHVRFVSCSATVANPQEHFKTIFGIEDVRLIDFDGSPSGRKEFICWNTPYRDPGDPASGRGDAMLECARLFCQLVLRGVRIIAFCRVRDQCERLVNAIKYEFEAMGRGECSGRVMGYRGGYTPQDRRRIESEMFEGKLLGIVATTALELGIDIGSLDCVLTWGFPYTISNLRQQSGRAGRRNKDSLSVLVGDCFPTDQHYMQNPDELFTKPNCALQVDLENMLVREGHIQCAAYEMPIRPVEDAQYFGKDLGRICEERLLKGPMGFFHCHDRFRPIPSRFVAIRDTEDEHFAIIDISHGRNMVLEELEMSRAFFTIYDGAIFLHQGNKYLVRDFDPDRRMARVEKVNVEWTTRQRDFTDIDPTETEAIKKIAGSLSKAFYGTIKIQQNVFGFFKLDKKKRVIDAVAVDNPPIIRFSKGMWLDIPREALVILTERRLHVAASIHAAEHAMLSLLPNFVISLPGDVRTECKVALKEFAQRESQRKRPGRLTFYDAKGGANGSGISTKAFEHVDHLLRQALERVEGCYCEHGCVECVASDLCKQANEVMSKAGSQVILKSLLSMEIDVDALPMGPEEQSPTGIETIVVAQAVPPRDRGGVVEIKEEDFEERDQIVLGDLELHTQPE